MGGMGEEEKKSCHMKSKASAVGWMKGERRRASLRSGCLGVLQTLLY